MRSPDLAVHLFRQKELVPVGPAFRGWEIISLIPGYLAASPVVFVSGLSEGTVSMD
jgi:hypothetical protein